MVPTQGVNERGAEDGAGQEHVPRRSSTRLPRRRPELRLRQAVPVPGPRGRGLRQRRAAGLDHAHQPRRRRGAPDHAARDDRRRAARRSATIDGSTWDPWAQRLLFTTGERRTRRRTRPRPDYPSTVVQDVSGAIGRGGYEGIQDDGDGNIWIVEDIGGANKAGTTGARSRTASCSATSRTAPATWPTGSCRCFGCCNAAGTIRSRRRRRRRSTRPTSSRCTSTARAFRRELDDDPRHRDRRHRAVQREHAREGTRTARRSSGRRTASSGPAPHFREFYFDETGDTNATQRRERERRRLGLDLQADARTARRPRTAARCRSSSMGTRRQRGLRQHRSSSPRDSLAVVGGRGRHAARPAQRARLRLRLGRRRGLRRRREPAASAGSPRAATLPQRSTRRSRGFGKNDGDNEITGTDVSDGTRT